MTTTEQAPAQAGITELLEQFESILCRNARIAGVESVSGYTDYVEDLEAERVARKNLRDALSALVSRLAELDARTCAFCSDLDVAHISVAGNHWCPSRAAEVLAATPEGPRNG